MIFSKLPISPVPLFNLSRLISLPCCSEAEVNAGGVRGGDALLHDSRTEVAALGEVVTIPAGDVVSFRVMRIKEPKVE